MWGEIVFDSEDYPAEVRVDAWRAAFARDEGVMEHFHACGDRFWSREHRGVLGPLGYWAAQGTPWGFRRTVHNVLHGDAEYFHVALLMSSSLNVARETAHDERFTVRTGELFIESSARPLTAQVDPATESVMFSAVRIPQREVVLPRAFIDRATGHNLSVRSGYSALLASLLAQLAADTTTYRRADGPRLGRLAVDLLSAHVAHLTDTKGALPPETRKNEHLVRAKAFIQQNLHNPDLTPAAVACAQHISLRYLHQIFRQEERTVAAWIRRKRLEGARRDLTDPAMTSLRIHEIAHRWCFSSPSDFTHSFKSAFGMSPTEFRCGGGAG